MESRTIAGPEHLRQRMLEVTSTRQMWPSKEFFLAKRAEQKTRHHKYFDTEYNLEPNIKGCPGGLRDVQTVGWVAKRHFGADTFDELVEHGFRLPSARDNRPLRFEEWEAMRPQTVHVSATPGNWEMERTGGEPDVVGQDRKTGEYLFFDCSPESPKGRISLCYDREGLDSIDLPYRQCVQPNLSAWRGPRS